MDYPVILLGAGGHAKVLLDMLLAQNVKVLGVTIPNPDVLENETFCGVPIIGNDDCIKNFDNKAVELVNGIGSVSSTELRRKIYENFKSLGYRFRNVIHPSAVVSNYSTLTCEGGVQVMAGAVVNIGTFIDENTIINTRASIDHDCYIGKHVHIAPSTTVCGGVKIGNGTHIGSGSIIIQGVTIGKGTVIGAGSLVLRDISDKILAYGSPAIVKKKLGNN